MDRNVFFLMCPTLMHIRYDFQHPHHPELKKTNQQIKYVRKLKQKVNK